MMTKIRAIAAILPLVVFTAFVARAENFRSKMEMANAQFLEAFNRPNPAGFLSLYTDDSVLLFQGAPVITGPAGIKQFWESRIKAGAKHHTFDIINAWAEDKYAYQIATASVQLMPETGEKVLISGYTVRVFEKQDDGTWKVKVHMFNRQGVP
jgi:ketosteroid isomerase-like protein